MSDDSGNLKSETIRLDQFLKLQNLVQSGGEAKHLIQNGEVKVNDQIEVRRGRKLQVGDVIEIFGQTRHVK